MPTKRWSAIKVSTDVLHKFKYVRHLQQRTSVGALRTVLDRWLMDQTGTTRIPPEFKYTCPMRKRDSEITPDGGCSAR